MAIADAVDDAARRLEVALERSESASILTAGSTASWLRSWPHRAARPLAALVITALACLGCTGNGRSATDDSPGSAAGLSRPAERDAGLGDSTAERHDTTAADHVGLLRTSLAAQIRTYVDSLGVVDPSDALPGATLEHGSTPAPAPNSAPRTPLAAGQLAELRAQLSREAVAALDAATSSEAMSAVLRAELESTLEAIHAYERAYGVPPHALSTEWSVISDTDLKVLRANTHANLVALEHESQRYADSERPASLEHRRGELASWSESLDSEAAARTQGRAPPVSQISPDISLAEARRNPTIVAAESRSHVFESKLRVQVELRSNWAPGDAGLENLRRTSASPAASAARADSVFTRVKENKAARPPPGNPAAPAGTPDPAQPELRMLDIAEDVRSATWDELDAIKARDTLGIVRARARQRFGLDWIKAAHGDGNVVLTRLSTHTPESLLALRAEYSDWYRKLASEDAANPGSLQHHAEASDARATIHEIDGELTRRYMVPRDAPRVIVPQDLASSPIAPERLPVLSALDHRQQAALAHEEAVQLELEANRFRTVPDARLMQAEEEAATRSLTADAEALHNAWSALDQQERHILIGERGAGAAVHAQAVAEARAAIVEASGQVVADLSRLPPRAAPAIRLAREKLAPLWTRGARSAPRTVTAALVQVERLSMVPPTGVSQPIAVAFLRDPGPHGPSDPEPPPPPGRPGPRPSPGGAGGLPEIEYIAPSSSAGSRPPESYSELFPEGETWTRNQRSAIEPRRAPGGIVIDVTIPDPIAHRIEQVTIDPKIGAIRIHMDGQWVRFEPAVDVAEARAAWAFVQDGRVPAADVRALALPEVAWLAPLYAGVPLYQMTSHEQRELRDELRDLTSVNLNPALVATAVGVDLMFADLAIFDLLPSSEIALEGDSRRFGIDVGPLWHAFWTDRARQRTDPEFGQQPFRKSLLVIKQSSATLVGKTLAASVSIEPSVFTMPLEGSQADPHTMAETTHWLTAHAEQIRAHVPALEQLARFAATTALFKTVDQRHISNDLNVLIGVIAKEFPTPRVFCRSGDALRCDRNRFARHAQEHTGH